MQDGNIHWELIPWGGILQMFEFSAPFCLGETRHYFKQCDLFRSFHAIVKVQFGGLARLDRAVNNYKDNLNSLYHHPDLTLTVNRVLHNIILGTYSHYIDLWPMNGACVGHCAVLMRSMLQFTMHYGCYQRRQRHLIKEHRRKGLPPSMPLPAIELTALLEDEEENLKLEQINMMHISIMEPVGQPRQPAVCQTSQHGWALRHHASWCPCSRWPAWLDMLQGLWCDRPCLRWQGEAGLPENP